LQKLGSTSVVPTSAPTAVRTSSPSFVRGS
jgi:hypothetical protein